MTQVGCYGIFYFKPPVIPTAVPIVDFLQQQKKNNLNHAAYAAFEIFKIISFTSFSQSFYQLIRPTQFQ